MLEAKRGGALTAPPYSSLALFSRLQQALLDLWIILRCAHDIRVFPDRNSVGLNGLHRLGVGLLTQALLLCWRGGIDRSLVLLLHLRHVMQRRAKKWQPWCSVASWYLWRACDLANTAKSTPAKT